MERRSQARRILAALEKHHPNAFTELVFHNPFELLIATILSAQCTDERVNRLTPHLFQRFPDANSLSGASLDELEALVKPTGFFRSKARSLLSIASALVDRHHGEVPTSMEALLKLPGVGRKTANVVLGHALDIPGLPVDRHVLRVSHRLGLTQSNNPVIVETELGSLFPPARWTRVSDTLIFHGRRICKPRPQCDRCHARNDCGHTADTQDKPTPPQRGR